MRSLRPGAAWYCSSSFSCSRPISRPVAALTSTKSRTLNLGTNACWLSGSRPVSALFCTMSTGLPADNIFTFCSQYSCVKLRSWSSRSGCSSASSCVDLSHTSMYKALVVRKKRCVLWYTSCPPKSHTLIFRLRPSGSCTGHDLMRTPWVEFSPGSKASPASTFDREVLPTRPLPTKMSLASLTRPAVPSFSSCSMRVRAVSR